MIFRPRFLRDRVTFEPIRHNAGKRHEQEERGVADKSDDAQHQLGLCQPINEPAHGNQLHPGADQGYRLAEKEQAKVSRAESANDKQKTFGWVGHG